MLRLDLEQKQAADGSDAGVEAGWNPDGEALADPLILDADQAARLRNIADQCAGLAEGEGRHAATAAELGGSGAT